MVADDTERGITPVVFGRDADVRVKTVRFAPRPERAERPVRLWSPEAPQDMGPPEVEAGAGGTDPAPEEAPAEQPRARDAVGDAADEGHDEGHDEGRAPGDAGPGGDAEPPSTGDAPAPEVAAQVAALEGERAALHAEHAAALAEQRARFDRAVSDLTHRLHHDVVELAVRLARRIVRHTVELDPSAIAEAARHALRLAGPIERVTIRCHPDDVAHLRGAAPDVAAEEAGRPVEVTVRPSDDIARGGVLLSFSDGIVDARVDKGLSVLADAVEAAMSGAPREDAIAGHDVEPGPDDAARPDDGEEPS